MIKNLVFWIDHFADPPVRILDLRAERKYQPLFRDGWFFLSAERMGFAPLASAHVAILGARYHAGAGKSFCGRIC
jgi:hypothetical protein